WGVFAEQVLAIEDTAFEQAVREPADELEDYFTDSDNIALIVENQEKGIIAYTVGGPMEFYMSFRTDDPHYGQEDSFYIASTAVHPDYQGRGIGKMMKQVLIDQVRQDDYSRICCHATSDAMVKLNQQFGFEKLKFFDKWVGDRSAWYMALELTKTQT
ncbi:MAG: GNAT family N-acetyltransferase, partial [Candidatus Altiarchaeota archaeon]|nr:GNAT family N-acetyltransferase [Candidatus Altiarchaeota archaeon]